MRTHIYTSVRAHTQVDYNRSMSDVAVDAWSALLQGKSHVTATDASVPTAQAAAIAIVVPESG